VERWRGAGGRRYRHEFPAKRFTCISQHPAYGGERDNWAEFDISLPISGTPETLTAAPV
jgi:hypothetical protein